MGGANVTNVTNVTTLWPAASLLSSASAPCKVITYLFLATARCSD